MLEDGTAEITMYSGSDGKLTVSPDSYAAQSCQDNGLAYPYPDSLDWPAN